MSKKEKMDPRVKRSRLFLRNALISLIAEKGYEEITVQEITKKADLNRATFYLHFQDKNDLLEQSIQEMLDELVHTLTTRREIARTENDKNKFTFLFLLFEHISIHAEFYRVMLGKRGLPGFTARLKEVLQDTFYNSLLRAQPDDQKLLIPREILNHYITSAHIGVILHWLENDMPYSPRYMASKLGLLSEVGFRKAAGMIPISHNPEL